MRSHGALIGVALILLFSSVSSGCLSLVMQREIMEDMREEPEPMEKEEEYRWNVMFESDSIEQLQYTNNTPIVIDKTASKMVITFVAEFPYSSFVEEIIDNGTNEVRYVEVKLWEPGVKESGGDPFWEVRATRDFPFERWEVSNLANGNWLIEIDARGYGWNAPISQFTSHDQFELTLVVHKPCVHFAEIHDTGECTDLSDLQSD